jgi:hypothetical protein
MLKHQYDSWFQFGIESQDNCEWWTEKERTKKEAIVTYFKALSSNYLKGLRKTTRLRSLSQNSKPRLSKYKVNVNHTPGIHEMETMLVKLNAGSLKTKESVIMQFLTPNQQCGGSERRLLINYDVTWNLVRYTNVAWTSVLFRNGDTTKFQGTDSL